MVRRQNASVLLSCIAFALLVLMTLSANLARLGSVIAREIQRAQIDYMQETGTGGTVEANALRLGQCLQREMLKSAHAGFVYSDTWAVAARVHALPLCIETLPPVAATQPVQTAQRVRPVAAAMRRSATAPAFPSVDGQ